MTRHFPSYEYPNEVITAAMMSKLSKYGQKFIIKDEDASEKIGELESQKEHGKSIFGGAYLLSEKAAAEKAAAEKAAAEKAAAEKAAAEKAAAQVWTLSEKEKEIINSLSNH
jgi:membrane protein involved in colicin uptake